MNRERSIVVIVVDARKAKEIAEEYGPNPRDAFAGFFHSIEDMPAGQYALELESYAAGRTAVLKSQDGKWFIPLDPSVEGDGCWTEE